MRVPCLFFTKGAEGGPGRTHPRNAPVGTDGHRRPREREGSHAVGAHARGRRRRDPPRTNPVAAARPEGTRRATRARPSTKKAAATTETPSLRRADPRPVIAAKDAAPQTAPCLAIVSRGPVRKTADDPQATLDDSEEGRKRCANRKPPRPARRPKTRTHTRGEARADRTREAESPRTQKAMRRHGQGMARGATGSAPRTRMERKHTEDGQNESRHAPHP